MTNYRDSVYPPKLKADLANESCMICETLFRKHSQQEFERCMKEIIKKAKDYPEIKLLRREVGDKP